MKRRLVRPCPLCGQRIKRGKFVTRVIPGLGIRRCHAHDCQPETVSKFEDKFKRLTLVCLAAAMWLTSCSSAQPAYNKQWTEVTTHLPDVEGKAEHDEVQNAGGTTTEYYPNRATPQRIDYRFPQGGFIEVRCLTGELHCRHWEMKVTGFRPGVPPPGFHMYLPEGVYTLTATDDPWVEVVKNQDQLTVGYWVANRHGQGAAMVKTYPEAVSLRDR